MDRRLFNSLTEDCFAARLVGAACTNARPMQGGSLFAGDGAELSPSSFTSSGGSLLGGDATHLSPSSFALRGAARLDEGAATALSPSSFGQNESQNAADDLKAQDGRTRRGSA